MNNTAEKPGTFLWVLRGLTTVFLLGYLVNLYVSAFIAELYPTGNLAQDLLAVGLMLLVGLGYYLMWIRKETLAGIVFIIWYAALFPADYLIGGDIFDNAPAPGLLLFILAVLLLAYRFSVGKKRQASPVSDT